jgi:hypothetical protein
MNPPPNLPPNYPECEICHKRHHPMVECRVATCDEREAVRDAAADGATPRTDAARCDVDTYAGEYMVDPNPKGEWVSYKLAEELERELNALRDIQEGALGDFDKPAA